ncbi:hypothetical protein TNCV_420931, partial [Trichonephila clavipes]
TPPSSPFPLKGRNSPQLVPFLQFHRVLCVKPPSVLCATPLQRISQEEVGHRISRDRSSGSLR